MKQQMIIRLDDAAERMDVDKWQRMELLLDKYQIKPLVGVIPDCQDPKMNHYPRDDSFWDKVHRWIDKDWDIAMHGYQHVYDSDNPGINPVNKRSEFAGNEYEIQAKKIGEGNRILKNHNIHPNVFFAPAHTFDENTIEAIKKESDVRIVSDTIARDVYYRDGITYVPVQSGKMRWLPLKTITYCLHPNTLDDNDFYEIDNFIKKNRKKFVKLSEVAVGRRRYDAVDKLLNTLYFLRKN